MSIFSQFPGGRTLLTAARRCTARTITKFLFVTFALGIIAAGCDTTVPKQTVDEKPIITVSILPQRYFVRRIAGDRFNIQVMIPPGHSPATYAPTPQQMTKLARSKIYFRIGHIPFEKVWIGNIASTNPGMRIVDTSLGVRLIETESHNHRHNEGDHEGRVDPHIWLSPRAVKIQVNNILNALIQMDPERQGSFEKNHETFIQDIDRMAEEFDGILEELAGKKFMVFHPAWSYLARDFQMVQLPIEIEGKEPTPADLKRLINQAKKENIKVILVQTQFDTHSAEVVAREIGGGVVQLDPLSEDWLSNVKKIAAVFRQSFK